MDEFDTTFINATDPVTSRVDDLVSLAIAQKEIYAVAADAPAIEKLNQAMDLVLKDLDEVINPKTSAELYLIHGGKH